ncbi:MAG: hypothetical protein V4735_05055 [Pseudomonadota bacterium]
MTLNVTGLPDTSSAAPQVRAVAQVISAPGITDAATIARQQMVAAAPAPTLIAAYAAQVATPPKPPVRTPAPSSSSAFAAQFIAQTPGATADDLELFSVPAKPQDAPEQAVVEDDFLSALRIARGDIPAMAAKAPVAAKAEPAPLAAPPPAVVAVVAASVPDITIRTTPALATALGLPLSVAVPVKKQTLLTTRGTQAYQLAEARVQGIRREPLTAVL